jgi:hypothetical protein
MFVVIYEPTTDIVLYTRRMGPYEKMDMDKFANMIAREYDREIDPPNGYIPNCSGDIRVEFRRQRDNGTVIWSGQSYYFKRDDD